MVMEVMMVMRISKIVPASNGEKGIVTLPATGNQYGRCHQ